MALALPRYKAAAGVAIAASEIVARCCVAQYRRPKRLNIAPLPVAASSLSSKYHQYRAFRLFVCAVPFDALLGNGWRLARRHVKMEVVMINIIQRALPDLPAALRCRAASTDIGSHIGVYFYSAKQSAGKRQCEITPMVKCCAAAERNKHHHRHRLINLFCAFRASTIVATFVIIMRPGRLLHCGKYCRHLRKIAHHQYHHHEIMRTEAAHIGCSAPLLTYQQWRRKANFIKIAHRMAMLRRGTAAKR